VLRDSSQDLLGFMARSVRKIGEIVLVQIQDEFSGLLPKPNPISLTEVNREFH